MAVSICSVTQRTAIASVLGGFTKYGNRRQMQSRRVNEKRIKFATIFSQARRDPQTANSEL